MICINNEKWNNEKSVKLDCSDYGRWKKSGFCPFGTRPRNLEHLTLVESGASLTSNGASCWKMKKKNDCRIFHEIYRYNIINMKNI